MKKKQILNNYEDANREAAFREALAAEAMEKGLIPREDCPMLSETALKVALAVVVIYLTLQTVMCVAPAYG